MSIDIAESAPVSESTDALEQLLVQPPSLDPRILVVDDNIRRTFDDTFESDPELVQLLTDVREEGVSIPIVAELTPDGSISVVDGQLRVLAARKAGLDAVPGWVRRAPDLDDKTRALTRVTKQLGTYRRVALSKGDHAAAVALMLDLGMPITKVSKATQLKKDVVKTTALIGKSPTARRLLDEGSLDLAQLEVIAEFENAGDTDAVARLEQTDARDFNWTAQLLRHERDQTLAQQAEALSYTEQGYRVLSEDDFAQGADVYVPIEDVRTLDGLQITPAATRQHAALWAVYLEHLNDELDITDAETGVPVDPDTVDWDTDKDRTAQAADGLRHADTLKLSPWRPWWYIRPDDMTAAGVMPAPMDYDVELTELDPVSPPTGDNDDSGVHSEELEPAAPGTVASVDDPDDTAEIEDPHEAQRRDAARIEAERLAAEQAARVEAARAEAARLAAERREAERQAAARIDKLCDQAKAVNAARRDWLVEHIVPRKTLTKDEAQFVAASLLRDPELLSRFGAAHMALRLLGFDNVEDVVASLPEATRGRADVYVYVLVLAGYERLITKDLWRMREVASGRENHENVAFYLRFLGTRGYPLVAIELAALGEIDPDSIEIDL
ncbi:ParB/RepB/Spo0J family partition protein [Nocardia transvalensis]|uniref:ParB/RepB/Spo0J family partition protein n=1 Tax=Nocardia transvalensis TaxID=37333 RepID=UPI001894F030|nr:ParB/RepB/Spo0J family partition protein [Nocardia transvalensis]MBF6333164.1 ParB N-terminal domain-containing protein [Nocardia transvalensis]